MLFYGVQFASNVLNPMSQSMKIQTTLVPAIDEHEQRVSVERQTIIVHRSGGATSESHQYHYDNSHVSIAPDGTLIVLATGTRLRLCSTPRALPLHRRMFDLCPSQSRSHDHTITRRRSAGASAVLRISANFSSAVTKRAWSLAPPNDKRIALGASSCAENASELATPKP